MSPTLTTQNRGRGLFGLLLFSALILAPAIANLVLADFSSPDSLTTLAYSLALWASWLALWGDPWRGCLLVTPLLVFTPAMLYLMVVFHLHLNPTTLAIALESNLEETREFLSALWLPASLGYMLLLAGAGGSLVLMKRFPVVWSHRWRICALALVPLIFGALHLIYRPLEVAGATFHNRPNPFRSTIWPPEIETVRSSSPFGLVIDICDAISAQRRVAKVAEAAKDFRFGAKQRLDYPDHQVYVLVIGESSRQDRWGINGYARPTSPRLRREPNLVSFRDVITVAPATRVSVPVILTRKPPDEDVTEFHERSLVSAFHEAGFVTYWLSTQAPLGYNDVTYALYAGEADHVSYFNVTGTWARTPPDGIMIAPLRRILATGSEPRQLIVIHTLGSHIEYRLRYPVAFDVFKPSLEESDSTQWHDAAYKEKLGNTYDNTILYSDYVLGEVIDAVKASGRPLAAVLYVSDHGEDLYDGGCDLSGHGKLTIAGLRVPMFLWRSPTYDEIFPGKIEMLEKHIASRLTTQAVFPLMLDMADIHFPGEDSTKSVLSATFVAQPKRMTGFLNGHIDFDRAHLNAECLLVE